MATLQSTRQPTEQEIDDPDVNIADIFKYAGKSMVSSVGGGIKRGIGNAFGNAIAQSPALSLMSSVVGNVWGLKDIKKKFGNFKQDVEADKFREETKRLENLVEKLSTIYEDSGDVNELVREIEGLSQKNKDLFYDWIEQEGGVLEDSLGNILIDFNDTVEDFAETLDNSPIPEVKNVIQEESSSTSPAIAKTKHPNWGGKRAGAGRPKGSKNKPKSEFAEFAGGDNVSILEKIKSDTGDLVTLYSDKGNEKTLDKILDKLTAEENLQKSLHKDDQEKENKEIEKEQLNEKILNSLEKIKPVKEAKKSTFDDKLGKLLTFIAPMAVATIKMALIAAAAYTIYKNWDAIISTIGDGIETMGDWVGKIAKWFMGDDEDGTLASGEQANIENGGFDPVQYTDDLRESQKQSTQPEVISQQNVRESTNSAKQREIEKTNAIDKKINENKEMKEQQPPVVVNTSPPPPQKSGGDNKTTYNQQFLNTRNSNSTYSNFSNSQANYPTNR